VQNHQLSLVALLLVLVAVSCPAADSENGWSFRLVLGPHGEPLPRVREIVEDRHGTMWFGTWGGGVYVFDGTEWRKYNAASGLASNWIRCLAEDHDGGMWVGGSDGLARIGSSGVEVHGESGWRVG
jgi:ligand-binding sensor domain-containing protein